jgi:ribonuclease D
MPDNPSQLLVLEAQGLQDVCGRLRQGGIFAFDTEFIRENSYLPKICLVQVASPQQIALIDPLAVDLAPFWELVLDAAVEKVVFAGEQDLELCHLQTGKAPRNIFDVQLAAGLAGLPYQSSYGNLVRLMLGHELEQGHAFSDWLRRPLTRAQLSYAVEDVLHLLEMKAALQDKLGAAGRLDWLAEEMRPYERPETYARPPELSWQRVRGHDRLGRRELGVLRELAVWREQVARQLDLPSRTAMRDECLCGIARRPPRTLQQLAAVRGLPRPDVQRFGQQILQAVNRGLAAPAEHCPPLPTAGETPTNKMLADLVGAAGQSLCLEEAVSPRLLANQSDFMDLVAYLRRPDRPGGGEAKIAPPSDDDLPRLLKGWRRQFAGLRLAELVTGQAALRIAGYPGNPHLRYEK